MTRLPSFLQTDRETGAGPAAPIAAAPFLAGSFGVLAQPAPWVFALSHERAADAVLWVTKGQGRVTIDGVRRGVAPHMAVFLPAGTLFSIDLSGTATALYAQGPEGFVPGMPGHAMILRTTDGHAQAELTGLIDALARELAQDRGFVHEALEGHMRLIAVWLKRQADAGADGLEPGGAAQDLVRRYARLVVKNYRRPDGMGTHARTLGVTPTHLSRACKQASGLTAAELLAERKLHAARAALAAREPSIQTIADRLGFTSAAYFTRFIRARTGEAPSGLRKAGEGLRLPL